MDDDEVPDTVVGGTPDWADAEHRQQTGPVLDQNRPTPEQRLAGLVEQLRADMTGQHADAIEKDVRHRLADTGIRLSDAQIAALVAELAG